MNNNRLYLENTKVLLCEAFSVGVIINPNMMSASQNEAYAYYNKKVAQEQLKILEAESGDEILVSAKAMFDNIDKLEQVLNSEKTNTSIKKLFENKKKAWGSETLELLAKEFDKLENKTVEEQNLEAHIDKQYLEDRKKIVKLEVSQHKILVGDVISGKFEREMANNSSVAWDLGYSSLEVRDNMAKSMVRGAIADMIDVVENLGAQSTVAGLNGRMGLSFVSRKANEELVNASFNPHSSQIVLRNNYEKHKLLQSTLIHEWTHAVDIISMEQAYPEYNSSVSGQLEPSKKIVDSLINKEQIANNDFIGVVKNLEDLTIIMNNKNPQVAQDEINKKQLNTVHKFYQMSLKEDWIDLNAEQRKSLDSDLMKDLVVKWLSSGKSEIIKGSLIDLLIPILGNNHASKISRAMDNNDYSNIQKDALNSGVKQDSNYYRKMNDSFSWEMKKMKMKSFFSGSFEMIKQMQELEVAVNKNNLRKYYSAPEEMLARQMESSFFPDYIKAYKKLYVEAKIFYPDEYNKEFKMKAREMVGNLEKACGIKSNTPEDIIAKLDQLREKIEAKETNNPTKKYSL